MSSKKSEDSKVVATKCEVCKCIKCICEKKEGSKSEEDQPQPEKKLELSTEAVNNFLNIIDVIMIGDPRGNSIMTHFQNMIITGNPELKIQTLVPQQA